MTQRDSQHPAAAAFFLALLLTSGAVGLRSAVLETGTVLFTNRDAMACCLPTEKYAVLVFRQLLTNIIAVPLHRPRGDAYIVAFVSFVHASARKAVNCSPPPVARPFVYALFDTVGGYLSTYLLPLSLEGFYAGNVRFSEVRKLHTMLEDIKDYLHTNGRGWRGPIKKYGVSHKVRSLNISKSSSNEDDTEICENFLLNSEPEVSQGGCIIPIPFLDDEQEPRSVALPVRFGSLHSIETPESVYLVLGHYVRSMQCLMSKNVSKAIVTDYNKKFRAWLIESVLPHLQDEKWYPAFGGILRVLRATGENCFGESSQRERRSIQRRLNEKGVSGKSRDVRSTKWTDSIHDVYGLRRSDLPQSKQEETRRYQENIKTFSKSDLNSYIPDSTDEYNGIKMNENHSFKNTYDVENMTSNERGMHLKKYDDQLNPREDMDPAYKTNIESDRVEKGKQKRYSPLSHEEEIQSYMNNMKSIHENMLDDHNGLSFVPMGMDYLSGEDNLVAIDEEALRKFKEPYNRDDSIVTSLSWSGLEENELGDKDRLVSFNIRAPRDPREYKRENSFSAQGHRAMVSQVPTATEAIEGSIIIGNETTNFTLLRNQEALNAKNKETNSDQNSDNEIQKSFHKGHTTKSAYHNDFERENTDPIPKKKKLKCSEILIDSNSGETNATFRKKAHRKYFGHDYLSASDKKHISNDLNKYEYDGTLKYESTETVKTGLANVPIEPEDEYTSSSVEPYMTTCFTTCVPVHYVNPTSRLRVGNEKTFRTFASCTTRGKRKHNTVVTMEKSPFCYGEKLFALDSTTDVNFDENENHDKKVVTTTHKGVKISKGIVYHQVDKITTKRSRLNDKKTERNRDMYGEECAETTKHKSRKEHSGRKSEEKSRKEDKISLIGEYVTTPITNNPSLSEFTWPPQVVHSEPPTTCQTQPPQSTQTPPLLKTQPCVTSQTCVTVAPAAPLFLGLFGGTPNGPWINVTDKCVVRACDGRHAPAPLVPHLLGDILQSPACNLDFYMYHIFITIILWLLLLCASLGQEDMHCRWRVEARQKPCRRNSKEFDKRTDHSQDNGSARYFDSPTYLSMDRDFSWHGANTDPRLLTLAPSYSDKRYRFAPWSEIGTKEERTPLYSSTPKSTSLPTSTCSVQQVVSRSNETKVEATNCIQPSVRPPLKFLLQAGNKFRYSSESEPPVSEAEEEHTIDEP